MVERKRRYFNVIEGDADRQPATPLDRVGDLLRNRREELGHDLADMAVALRIRLPYLEAIEHCRYGDLPGQAYVTGFLRTYAQALGLDVAVILRRYKEEAADTPQSTEMYFPEAVNENRVPGGALMVIAGLLALLVYAGWYVLSTTDRSLAELVPPLPPALVDLVDGDPVDPPTVNTATRLAPEQAEALVERSQPTAPEVGVTTATTLAGSPGPAGPSRPAAVAANAGSPPAPAAATQGATQAAPQAAADDESELPPIPDLGTGPAPPVADSADPQTEPAGPVAAAPEEPVPVQTGAGRVFGVNEGPVRLVILAVEQSWIEVRDAKGTLWTSRILRAGDQFRAPDVPGLTLVTGNAGGLKLTVDGRELAPLGEKGQVLRQFPLDPDGLKARAR
jgi:cytoskeleton protein RodZ